MDILKPYKLNQGDTIGIFTPSSPAYKFNVELFQNGVKNLEAMGFKVKLGSLTKARSTQGYRSASGVDRANEFMELIDDPQVKCLISTIGGMNSNSMIPFLNFARIRKSRKIICGFSDVTSLHLSILKFAGLKTLYGPAVMTWFGEYPDGVKESVQSFLERVTTTENTPIHLQPFARWSNHFRDWGNGDWKNIPRQWQVNSGWTILNSGSAVAEMVVANLNTLISAAGTKYFPDLSGKILLIEEMSAPFSLEERSFRQLQLMGVFDQISGLIIGKPEVLKTEGAPFSYDQLILEIVGQRNYPIISNFDCGHTLPMHSIGECTKVSLNATEDRVEVHLLDSFVS